MIVEKLTVPYNERIAKGAGPKQEQDARHERRSSKWDSKQTSKLHRRQK